MLDRSERSYLQAEEIDKTDRFSSTSLQQRVDSQTDRVAVVLPTLNAGQEFARWIQAFKSQTIKPKELLLIDSSSEDNTVEIGQRAGFITHIIKRSEFSHGGTRQMGVSMLPDCDIIIFLTQDAILAEKDSLENLIKPFSDANVGVAYGRQLPHHNANAIEAHARFFNYPDCNETRSQADILTHGIKTSFSSNSFSAWRREALMSVGGFPSHTIQNEDAWVASKLILTGWKIAYCADAPVYHSHGYSLFEEFKRYFDIGVFHKHDSWIRYEFGQAEGEGMKFIKSEYNFLKAHEPIRIPEAIIRNGLKFIGYKLGQLEKYIPRFFKKTLSSNRAFWSGETIK